MKILSIVAAGIVLVTLAAVLPADAYTATKWSSTTYTLAGSDNPQQNCAPKPPACSGCPRCRPMTPYGVCAPPMMPAMPSKVTKCRPPMCGPAPGPCGPMPYPCAPSYQQPAGSLWY